MTALLAWTPLVEPLHVLQPWWYLLLLPLAFGISVIYKAMRVWDLRRYWRQVAMMTTQIVLVMIVLAVLLSVFIEVVIPMAPVE